MTRCIADMFLTETAVALNGTKKKSRCIKNDFLSNFDDHSPTHLGCIDDLLVFLKEIFFGLRDRLQTGNNISCWKKKKSLVFSLVGRSFNVKTLNLH